LYENDPLTAIINEIGGNLDEVRLGSLDLSLILDSEYCFS
jgi:hypothetical protein